MDKPNDYWSRRFIESLKTLPSLTPLLRQALDTALEEYLFIRKLVGDMTKQIRALSTQKSFAHVTEFDTRYTWNRVAKLNGYYHRTTGHETI